MLDQDSQFAALYAALEAKGFAPLAEARHGSIILRKLPEFPQPLIFTLTITMENPLTLEWDSLFDGCLLESGSMVKGAAHKEAVYSRKKAVERAKQEKWAALWSLYDGKIIDENAKPDCLDWQDVTLP